MKDDEVTPKDHAEAVAIFRAQVIGPLACRTDWTHGELAEALRALSAQPFRPPGSDRTRRYAPSTLERWLYAWRSRGLDGLRPRRRCDRGHGRALTNEQRDLLLDIRRDHPQIAATVIRRSLVTSGRLPAAAISDATLRRLYAEHGLDRKTVRRRDLGHPTERRRWQAARAHQVWHADVMHGPALDVDGRSVPLRIHAILDDRTRYVVAIQACATERESEMLALLVRGLRRHGSAETLYLDYVPGHIIEVLCPIALCGGQRASPHSMRLTARFGHISVALDVTIASASPTWRATRRASCWSTTSFVRPRLTASGGLGLPSRSSSMSLGSRADGARRHRSVAGSRC